MSEKSEVDLTPNPALSEIAEAEMAAATGRTTEFKATDAAFKRNQELMDAEARADKAIAAEEGAKPDKEKSKPAAIAKRRSELIEAQQKEHALMNQYGLAPEAVAAAKAQNIGLEQLIEAKRTREPEVIKALEDKGIHLVKTDSEIAHEHGIPAEALDLAKDKGLPLEYIVALKQSADGRERLREVFGKEDWIRDRAGEEAIIKEYDIPDDIVRKIEASGRTIEEVADKLRSPEGRAELEKDFGKGKWLETIVDPRLTLLRQGKAHLEATDRRIYEIENKPGKLRRSLKGSIIGKLPVLGRIPVVGKALESVTQPIYLYYKSWRIYFHHRRTRPKDYKEEVKDNDGKTIFGSDGKPITRKRKIAYNDGFLGIGGDYRRDALRHLKEHNRQVKLTRSKLSRLNRHNLMGSEALRRKEAERILRLRNQEANLRRNILEPVGFYRHFDGDPKTEVFDPVGGGRLGYKPAMGKYLDNRPTLEPGKYAEFPVKTEDEPEHDVGEGASGY